jgi:hypothetical protein
MDRQITRKGRWKEKGKIKEGRTDGRKEEEGRKED